MKPQKRLLLNRIILKRVKIALLFIFTPLFLLADAHIFVYHRFGDDRYPSTNTTIKELTKEFNYFKNNGYKVIKLSTLIEALKNHKKIDDKWIVLTIDDNFKSFYKNGLPIFKKYGYPFSLFVYIKATQEKYPDYTSWDELKEISKYGSLEFHSYSHPHMTYKSDSYLRKDFKKGLKLFKDKLGITPKYFAYPYGEYNNRVKKIAKEFGFEAILNQNIGAISKDSDIYDLDRNALVGKAHLKTSLKYKELHLKWIEPKRYPKNGILKNIMAQLKDKNPTGTAGYYLSGYGWHRLNIKDGLINEKIDKKLLFERNRIAINVKNAVKTKLLIKDRYDNR